MTAEKSQNLRLNCFSEFNDFSNRAFKSEMVPKILFFFLFALQKMWVWTPTKAVKFGYPLQVYAQSHFYTVTVSSTVFRILFFTIFLSRCYMRDVSKADNRFYDFIFLLTHLGSSGKVYIEPTGRLGLSIWQKFTSCGKCPNNYVYHGIIWVTQHRSNSWAHSF